MASSRMELDVSFRRGGRPRSEGRSLQLLVLADLGGAREQPLAARAPRAVDVDAFDAVFAALAPRLTLALDGTPLRLDFAALEDFHPDRLHDRLAPFESLRRLRQEIDDPQQWRRAAAALGPAPTSTGTSTGTRLADAGTAAPSAAAAPAPVPTDLDAARDDVARLLGRAPSRDAATPAAVPGGAAAAMAGWLRQLVAPHVLPAQADEQRGLRAAVDQATAALMRQLLHHPALQALEAAWRGVDRLVREAGDTVQVHLLDAGFDEIAADLRAHEGDLAASALHRLLQPQAAGEGRRWDLWVLDQAFGPDTAEVQQLATLGALAARAGTPLLAAATPALAGCAEPDRITEPARWLPPQAAALVQWQALRSSPMAPWIGLALPRVLMRLPHGAKSDPIERFAFEEMAGTPRHEDYLWGPAALALALLAARAWDAEAGGFRLDDAAALELEDLPGPVVTEADGSRRLQPAAEWLLGDAAAEALSDRGLMPLLSRRDRAAARLLRWQSVAEPLQALRGMPEA